MSLNAFSAARVPCVAVAPADGQRVRVGDASLAADRRRHGRLEHLGDARQRRTGVDAAHPRVDPDPPAPVRQQAQHLAIRWLVEGQGGRRGERAIVVPSLGVERERDHDGHGARLARDGDPVRLVDRTGDLGLVADLQHSLADRPEQGHVGQRVDLADRRVRPPADIGHDPDDRDAVEQRLADAGHRVGQPRPGHDAEDPDRSRNPGRGVGHDARRRLVGHEQIGHPPGLQRVPELVVLRARHAEDAGNALAAEGRRRGLRASHAPLDARPPNIAADLDVPGPRRG